MWGTPYRGHQVDSRDRMMAVIVIACAAFGLTVSKAETEINYSCKQKARGSRRL